MKYCLDLNLFFSVLAKSLIFSPDVVWSGIQGERETNDTNPRKAFRHSSLSFLTLSTRVCLPLTYEDKPSVVIETAVASLR